MSNAIKVACFILVAPVPFTGMSPNLYQTMVVFAVFSGADGIIVVSTFSRVFATAIKIGLKDDISTNMLVSGKSIKLILSGLSSN